MILNDEEDKGPLGVTGATKPWSGPWVRYPIKKTRSGGSTIRGRALSKPPPGRARTMREVAHILRNQYSATTGELRERTSTDGANGYIKGIIDSLCMFLPIWETADEQSRIWYGLDHEHAPEVTNFEKALTDYYVDEGEK